MILKGVSNGGFKIDQLNKVGICPKLYKESQLRLQGCNQNLLNSQRLYEYQK